MFFEWLNVKAIVDIFWLKNLLQVLCFGLASTCILNSSVCSWNHLCYYSAVCSCRKVAIDKFDLFVTLGSHHKSVQFILMNFFPSHNKINFLNSLNVLLSTHFIFNFRKFCARLYLASWATAIFPPWATLLGQTKSLATEIT